MLMRRFFLPAGAAALLLVSVIGLAQERRPAASDVSPFADQRAPIALSDDESAFVRREMRGLLESVRDMLEASSAGDRAGIAAAARRAGLNGPEAEHIPKSLAPKLPPEFRKFALATHRGFDQIALDVEQPVTTERVQKQLVELMGNCISCHATWRLTGEGGR